VNPIGHSIALFVIGVRTEGMQCTQPRLRREFDLRWYSRREEVPEGGEIFDLAAMEGRTAKAQTGFGAKHGIK
jgi:hypothetical protein